MVTHAEIVERAAGETLARNRLGERLEEGGKLLRRRQWRVAERTAWNVLVGLANEKVPAFDSHAFVAVELDEEATFGEHLYLRRPLSVQSSQRGSAETYVRRTRPIVVGHYGGVLAIERHHRLMDGVARMSQVKVELDAAAFEI